MLEVRKEATGSMCEAPRPYTNKCSLCSAVFPSVPFALCCADRQQHNANGRAEREQTERKRAGGTGTNGQAERERTGGMETGGRNGNGRTERNGDVRAAREQHMQRAGGSPRNIPEVSPTHTRNMPETYMTHPRNIPETFKMFSRNLPETSRKLRYESPKYSKKSWKRK